MVPFTRLNLGWRISNSQREHVIVLGTIACVCVSVCVCVRISAAKGRTRVFFEYKCVTYIYGFHDSCMSPACEYWAEVDCDVVVFVLTFVCFFLLNSIFPTRLSCMPKTICGPRMACCW